MSVGVFDNLLHKDTFSTPRMRRVFCDSRTVQSWLDVEAALARVQGRLGLIPDSAAAEISSRARYDLMDPKAFAADLRQTGHPFVALVNALVGLCDDDSGQYVHWGATSQDITDTALVLQLREAIAILTNRLTELSDTLAEAAVHHRDLPMVGRTNGQHAVPMTLGFKLARWTEELDRSGERFAECLPRLLVAQFSGAIGTFASLGQDGLAVQRGLAAELGLDEPGLTWHAARDSLQEVLSVVAVIASSVGKMADELYTMQKPELAEAAEAVVAGRVGSSTMPQKRNPFTTTTVSGLCRLATSTTAAWLTMPGHDGERDARALLVESDLIPRAFLLLDAALSTMTRLLGSLHFDADGLAANLDRTAGLIASERVMMALAPYLGRHRSHALVHRLASQPQAAGQTFGQVLLADAVVRTHLDEAAVKALLDMSTYVGQAPEEVDRMIARRASRRNVTGVTEEAMSVWN